MFSRGFGQDSPLSTLMLSSEMHGWNAVRHFQASRKNVLGDQESHRLCWPRLCLGAGGGGKLEGQRGELVVFC